VGSMDTTFKFKIEFNVYDCVPNCSGHGVCNKTTHICACLDFYGDPDCGEYTRPLQFGVPFDAYVPPNEFSYFVVNVSQQEAIGQIDMLFAVTENDPSNYPRIYASPYSMGVPTVANHLYASPLPLTSLSQIRIPAGVLEDYGATLWIFGINSYSLSPFEVSILASIEGYCPNDCSFNGACQVDQATFQATCACTSGWSGGGCDVTSDSLDNDNVDTGLFVGLIFVFLIIGFLVGLGSSFLIKKCKEQKPTVTATTTNYSAVGES